jgi:hypothetical protein
MTDPIKSPAPVVKAPLSTGNPADEVKRREEMAGEDKRNTSGDQKVRVKALHSFHKDGNMTGEMVGPDSEPFEVERSRAAELRASGLIEFEDESTAHDVHGKEAEQRVKERLAQEDKMRAIPENSKGTPLRNPKLEYADIDHEGKDTSKDGKRK